MIRLCLLALALLASLAPAAADTRRALVIGNDRYAHIERLQKARNDARAVAERLEGLGFEVTRLLDADRRDTARALARFAARLGPGDTAFLFFAGHGVEIDGENYLLPVDIPAPDPSEEFLVKSEGLPLSRTLTEIRETGARLTLAVIDACRNNPFPKRGTRSLGREMGLAMNRPPEGTFIIYSAGSGQTALDRLSDDDPDPNSVFTRAFLDLMERPGLDIRRFAVELRRKVTRLAATVGHPQRPGYYDEVLGDFAFLPGADTDDTVNSAVAPVAVAPEETRPPREPTLAEYVSALMRPSDASFTISGLRGDDDNIQAIWFDYDPLSMNSFVRSPIEGLVFRSNDGGIGIGDKSGRSVVLLGEFPERVPSGKRVLRGDPIGKHPPAGFFPMAVIYDGGAVTREGLLQYLRWRPGGG